MIKFCKEKKNIAQLIKQLVNEDTIILIEGQIAYCVYKDIFIVKRTGGSLVTTEILLGLNSEIPIVKFPYNKRFTGMKNITTFYQQIIEKNIFKNNVLGVIIKQLGNRIVAFDLN